jgi:hypothetical protein
MLLKFRPRACEHPGPQPARGACYWQAACWGLHQIPFQNPDLWYKSLVYWQVGKLKTWGLCGPMKQYLKGLIDAGSLPWSQCSQSRGCPQRVRKMGHTGWWGWCVHPQAVALQTAVLATRIVVAIIGHHLLVVAYCQPHKLQGWLHPEVTGSQTSGKFVG